MSLLLMLTAQPAPSDAVSGDASTAEGSLDASSSQFGMEDRLNRLVERVMNGLCVPFLGAGVSIASPAPVNAPTINASEIAKNLAKKLFKHLPPKSDTAAALQSLRKLGLAYSKLDDDGNPLLSTSNAPDIPSLGEVAELCWSVLGPTGTCAVLELERWKERLPTAAHHYLAVLIREGLVTEVLETNYDEFVEQAVLETFGKDPEASSLCATVISDLDSYRRHIAKPRDNRKQHALVKVIKLNGCAAAYSRVLQDPCVSPSEREMAARRIILTEEQMQSWGDKHWARELLNDRVRSRTLLFVGFGHADPLVRHHSVQVMREFQIHAVVSSLRPHDLKDQLPASPWYDLNNAPFIAAFLPALSFYQYQILRAFRDAHTLPDKSFDPAEPNGGPRPDVLTHVASVYENTFLGGDGPFLRPLETRGGAKDILPADQLFEVLTARCICRLVSERWLSPESPLHSYLQGALRQPRALLSELCQVLFSGDLDRPALFAEWLRLQNPSKIEQASSPWAAACFATRGQPPGRAGYRSFLDSPIKQPMLIVLMALVASRNSLGRLMMPSGKELLTRAGAATTIDSVALAEDRVAAYRIVDPEPAKGVRAVFATANVDRFLYGDTSAPRVVTHDAVLPDHSVVIGLGRGNVGAFRRQVWFEVCPAKSETSVHSSNLSSVPPNVAEVSNADTHCASTVDSGLRVRAVREIYVVGDLAAIRGGRSVAVGTNHAHENIQSLARSPESLLGVGDGWRRYCQELN